MDNATALQGLYVAYFGRAADPDGFEWWLQGVETGGYTFEEIATSFGFSDSGEAQEMYPFLEKDEPSEQDVSDFVDAVYMNLFNREPDEEGKEFWTNALLQGDAEPGDFIWQVMQGAQKRYEDGTAINPDWEVLNSKIEVADAFTAEFKARGVKWDADTMRGLTKDVIANTNKDNVEEQTVAIKELVPGIPGDKFTLTEGDPQIEIIENPLMWGDESHSHVTAEAMLKFFNELEDLDLVDLGILDEDGVYLDNVQELNIVDSNDIHIELDGDFGSIPAEWYIEIVKDDGTTITTQADVDIAYLQFLQNLIQGDGGLLFDDDGDPRIWKELDDKIVTYTAPILTPDMNHGVMEQGYTSDDDDTIVAGRLELLHGAYLDGGGGYNTLEVDAKGYFAQPFQLLNIQKVDIQNLPNIYDLDYEPEEDYESELYEYHYYYDWPITEDLDEYATSILDLSRATSLEHVVISEGLIHGDPHPHHFGELVVTGIRNGATLRLEGGFTQDVYTYFGRGMTSAVDVELMLGDTEGVTFNIANNANSMNLHSLTDGTSTVSENWLENAYFGGSLRELNITGNAALYIQGDLSESFHAGRPATINASENTAGVDLNIRDHEDVEFIGSQGDDVFSVRWGSSSSSSATETVYIDATAGGNNQFDVIARDITIIGGDGDDFIEIGGIGTHTSAWENQLVKIDTGAGENDLVLGLEGIHTGAWGIHAREGSYIDGENITIHVKHSPSDLAYADLRGDIQEIILHELTDSDGLVPTLTISAEQFADLGPEVFTVYNNRFDDAVLNIEVSNDFDLTKMDLSGMDSSLLLNFVVMDDVNLTITAEQLHKYVQADGVTLADDPSTAWVQINNAGYEFDPLDGGAFDGGSLDNNDFDGTNYGVDQSAQGFERFTVPEAWTRLTWDTDVDGTEVEAFTTTARYLRFVGDEGFTFYPTEDHWDEFGRWQEGASSLIVGDGHDSFIVDFFALGGPAENLTIGEFERVDAMRGNGTSDEPARVNVEITDEGDEGVVADEDSGLWSQGIQTYVVTKITDDGDLAENGTATFYTSTVTRDLEFLGLQGNYTNTIEFRNVERGVEFLMEAAYDKSNGYVVGTLDVEFARPGADAVVEIAPAEGVDLDGEAIRVGGIELTNADTLTLTSADDVTLEVSGDELNDLESFDATGVEGTMTLEVSGTADLSGLETLEGIDQVMLEANAELVMTPAQAEDIGAENFLIEEGDTATLNLTGLTDELFSVADYAEGITVTVTLADEEEITLNPGSDLTDVGTLTVGEETTLTLTGDQLVQLATSGGGLEGEGRVVVTGFTQDHVNALREWAAAEEQELNFSGFLSDDLERIVIEAGSDLEFEGFVDADNAQQTVTFGDLVDDADPNDTVLRFELNGSQITLATTEQADGLRVNDGNVKFTFVDEETSINMANYTNIGEVEVYALLVNRNENIENLFLNLASSVPELENIIRIVDTPPHIGIDRAVIIDEGVTTVGDMQFITADASDFDENVANVWINFEGGSTLDGSIILDRNDDDLDGYFDTLYLISRGEDPNTITGGIIADGSSTAPGVANTGANNFLNLVIDTNSDLIIEGDIEFNALEDESTAYLTLSGDGDVVLAGIDYNDDNVDELVIDKEDLGGSLILTDDHDFTDLDDLTVLGNSADNPIVLDEGVTLTLTAEQANNLHIVAAEDADTATIDVNIEGLENDVTYDFSGVQEEIAGEIFLADDLEYRSMENIAVLEQGTDLGYMAVHLIDEDEGFRNGQTIKFVNPEQASRTVNVDDEDGNGNTNVVWGFDSISGTLETDYSDDLGRLWFRDVLADGENLEELFTQQLPDTILRIEYTGEFDIGAIPTDRTVEVEAFTQLEDGLSFSDHDQFFVENLTIDLGGQVDLGDLMIDNLLGPGVDPDEDDSFQVLTINSILAVEEDSLLMPQDWEDGDVLPRAENTIGDISSGPERNDLRDVVINTEGFDDETNDTPDATDFTIGTIYFSAPEAGSTGTLEINDDGDVTLKAVDFSDANITTGTVDTTGHNGVYNTIGGSAAIVLDYVETLNLFGEDEGNRVFGFDADDVDLDVIFDLDGTIEETLENIEARYYALAGLDRNPTFSGAGDLTEVNVTGESNLELGIISGINSEEFTFNGAGENTFVTLGDVSLAADGEWNFSEAVVTITEDASFDDDGELNFTDSIVLIDGNVDLSGLEDNLTLTNNLFGVHLGVLPGSQVTLTIDQHDAFDALYTVGEGSSVRIVGEGTVSAYEYVGKYVLAMDEGDVEFIFNDDATDVDLTREGNDYVATLVGIDELSGDWDGFEDTDVLRIGADIDVSEVNDGANLGGIGSLHFSGANKLSLTADQNEALRDSIEDGDGEITGSDVSLAGATIEFTEVVDTSIGIEGIANYELYNDLEDNVGNVFEMAATDQRVVAGDQDDRLYANLGADVFELGAGDDEVVYDDAEQSLSITELDDTDVTVIAGTDERGQTTVLTFVAVPEDEGGVNYVDQDNADGDPWTYTITTDGATEDLTIEYTLPNDGATLQTILSELSTLIDAEDHWEGDVRTPERELIIKGVGDNEGDGEDYTVNIEIRDSNTDLVADHGWYVVDADADGEDVGEIDLSAADQIGGSIEINITEDEAGMINGINLEYDDGTGFERLVDYNIDFDEDVTDGVSLADELQTLTQIDTAVFDDGVLTLQVEGGESIQLADGYDSAFITQAFDSIDNFDDGDNVLDFSAFGFADNDFLDTEIALGAGIDNVYEAAVFAKAHLDNESEEFGFFELDSNTYIYADINGDDEVDSDDLLIELVGVQGNWSFEDGLFSIA